MKILVVDDENIVLESCRRVLEAEGFEILLVESVNRAIKIIEDDDPALLLVDAKMPEHDGMYLMQEVKKKWPDKPVIIMSGYSTTEMMAEVTRMGAKNFIAKPFTPDELIETVYQTIKKEKKL